MPKPQYPTKEGIWSKGERDEDGYAGVSLGTPYNEAVENFRQAIQGRADFDPAVLFVWGTMQAKAVLNILKAVEETFGEQGQDLVRKAINKAGYEAGEGLLENSAFPDDLGEVELISYVVTGINTVLYASLEKPWITSESRCEFDILWCPHQDIYTAFDCRVQRYFVEGMIQAMEDKAGLKAHPLLHKLIPRGAECCHFSVDKLEPGEGKHPWHAYSDELGQRAMKKLAGEE
jgi:hypothetical protein